MGCGGRRAIIFQGHPPSSRPAVVFYVPLPPAAAHTQIIKAAAKALRDVPEANCFYDLKTDTVKVRGRAFRIIHCCVSGLCVLQVARSSSGEWEGDCSIISR